MSLDRTKYEVVELGPLTASGTDEILATFEFKKDAMAWIASAHGKHWRRYYAIRSRVV